MANDFGKYSPQVNTRAPIRTKYKPVHAKKAFYKESPIPTLTSIANTLVWTTLCPLSFLLLLTADNQITPNFSDSAFSLLVVCKCGTEPMLLTLTNETPPLDKSRPIYKYSCFFSTSNAFFKSFRFYNILSLCDIVYFITGFGTSYRLGLERKIRTLWVS